MFIFNQTAAFYISELRHSFAEYANTQLEQCGLMQGQLYFILYIGKHEGCSPKEMGEVLKTDAGHATRSLQRLQESGFLIQKADERDRRRHQLFLTEKGRQAFQLSHDVFFHWDEQMQRGLTEAERVQLGELLGKMLRAAKGKQDT